MQLGIIAGFKKLIKTRLSEVDFVYSYTPINLLVDHFSLLGREKVFLLCSLVFPFNNTSSIILCLHPFLPTTLVYIAFQFCMSVL